MKIRVCNLAGRHLGTYDAETDREAFDRLAQEGGYPNGDVAEAKRFAAFERLVFTEVQ